MLLDLSLPIDISEIPNDDPGHALGHVGTHFDVMEGRFPIDSFRTSGILVDISRIRDREVEIADLDGYAVPEGAMVIFHTGFMAELGYGLGEYNRQSAYLSDALVNFLLLDRKVKLIGVDAAGIQKPKKHLAVDMLCASHNVFVVENLANIPELLRANPSPLTVYTMPLSYRGLTGLPCRVLGHGLISVEPESC